MKLLERRRAAVLAERTLVHERARWHIKTMSLRARIAHHRAAIVMGGGALAGLVCGMVPMGAVARVGRLVASTAAFALRTPIGAMLFEEMRHRTPERSAAPADQAHA